MSDREVLWGFFSRREDDPTRDRFPVTEMELFEYDKDDEHGFRAVLRFVVKVEDGSHHVIAHRMREPAFRYFVEEVAKRYRDGVSK